MKLTSALYTLALALALAVPLLAPSRALASPGAHGPNGEHLDAPAAGAAGASAPQIETFSELFELTGQLSGGELSLLVDRYDSNEPVLNGKLEVQYKDIKAQARYHADIGDYAVDDPRLLKALATPGKHALLFTFVAGEESDLLEATLEVGPQQDADHAHGREAGRRWWWWLLAPVLAAAAMFVMRGRKQ